MNATADEASLRIWGPYHNYQDEARFEYGRRMWRIPEMRARLLAHWLDERHPWRERFIERRQLIEEILTSDLGPEELNQQLLSGRTSLGCVAREIPPVFGSFFPRVSMNPELAGKVVLVTGASGGIGSAIARSFAAEGATVVLHYHRNRRSIAAIQRELSHVKTLIVKADLTSEAQVKQLFSRAMNAFGGIDTLIANAGWWETKDVPLHKMSLGHWQRTIEGVLTTCFLSVREFMQIAARQKQGNAVLIASTAAVFGEAGHADYASGKAAIAYGLTRSLKNEISRLAPHTRTYCGGRINCICPGWTVVPRSAARLRAASTVRKVTATMALPQIARPEDIAHAAVFLSSDTLARHITGQTLVIAGGMEGRLLWEPGEIDPALV